MKKQTNIKKILLFAAIVALLTVLFCVSASAETYSGTCGDDLTWSLDTETGELVIEGTGEMNRDFWSYRSYIKTIVIEEGVTDIGFCAFEGCYNLTSVTIPNSVTSIGEAAFEDCTGLTSVTIGESVDSIGGDAFRNCTGLTSITIPDSVTSIGNCAFFGCSITAVHITDLAAWCEISFVDYSANPLYYARSLYLKRELVAGDLVIPDGVTNIGSCAFYNCTGLTSVTIPDSVTNIGSYAFYNCTGLTSVTIGNGVVGIDDHAFYRCTGLTSVTISDSVMSIGRWAFANCTGLTSVTVGSGVTRVDVEAFSGCTNLAAVHIYDLATWCEISFNSDGKYNPANPLYYAKNLYLEGELVSNLVIPDGVTIIKGEVFYGCTSLTSVTIPNSVTFIRGEAFYGCTSLTSVTIGNGVTSIGDYAFAYCTSLTSATIPDSVTSIDCGAFRKCTGLASITVLSADATIYDSANTISDTATIYGFAGSTAEEYATKYSRTFVPLAADITSVFELEATYAPDAEKAGQYLPVTTFTRTDDTSSSALVFLFVECATGELYVKSTEGVYLALYDEEGSALALGSEATDIAVIYDDNSGVARFYVDGVIPYVGDEMVLANLLPVHDATFHTMVAVTDTFDTLDGVSVTNVYNINASGTADFVGFQVSTDDSRSIRILAGLDTLYYSHVGFDIRLYSNGILQGTVSTNTNTVYYSVMANGEAVTSTSMGYRYLSAIEINDIARGDYPFDVEVCFIVRPYTTVGGQKLYSEAKKIVITYDSSAQKNVYTLDKTYTES